MKRIDVGSIDTLILCGGKGTRLKSIVRDKPKILVDIGDLPFIEYLLNFLESEGIKRIILCTGYKHDQIEKWVKSSYSGDLKIILSREREALGTGGAIKNAQKLIHSNNLLVINGDTFCKLNYYSFVRYFYTRNAVVLLALKKLKNNKSYGNIKIDSMNRIISFIEKENSFDRNYFDSTINAGVYLISKDILELIPSNANVSFECETMQLIMKKFKDLIYGFDCEGSFIDIGTPRNYYRAHKILEKYA